MAIDSQRAIEAPLKPNRINVLFKTVSEVTGIGKADLIGPDRKRSIVRPRWIMIYILKTKFGLSYTAIGRIMGDRHHTTILHTVRELPNLMMYDEELERMYKHILGIVEDNL